MLCCIFSACILSNETVNIWSHMLGLIYFTLLQIDDNFHFLPENGADAGDHFTFTIMNLCFQVTRKKETVYVVIALHVYIICTCTCMHLLCCTLVLHCIPLLVISRIAVPLNVSRVNVNTEKDTI